ncbi:hypothetical protein [Uliginosibacterium sp. H1]|uniref:hypothetical protein n=1 Tax=Uliginosibacterium sp. H1 TaxID=3114757 RepID=UPI002E18BEF0|nr:hypothetical protein [Uliginosibacterium sp. H1]
MTLPLAAIGADVRIGPFLFTVLAQNDDAQALRRSRTAGQAGISAHSEMLARRKARGVQRLQTTLDSRSGKARFSLSLSKDGNDEGGLAVVPRLVHLATHSLLRGARQRTEHAPAHPEQHDARVE